MRNFFVLFVLFVVLLNCAKTALKDGVYGAKSSPDDTGAWAEVTLTIAKGEIADVEFITRQKDGTVKGEDYGKVNGEISNQAFYDKAQLAVRAMKRYEDALKTAKDLHAVEAVSGATVSYNQFTEAVEKALEQAEQ
jgi:major membrane immunogen (membrane-anchored lipoprotein)